MATEQRDPKRLLQYMDSFFGVRNKIKGNPIEGINFTLETLSYMTSHNRADQITDMIVSKMRERGQKIPFGVFECCAGIGGNTMSFLDNPAVQWVVSYELRRERRDMLKRNIAMYDLAKGNRSYVPDESFTGVPVNYKGVVLYFDPPWLPETIKGHESTKEQYILEGIKVGDKTLEEWIASCPNCAMVVARVPPGYRFKPIAGWNVESVLLKNSLVLFVTPSVPAPVVIPAAAVTPITTASVVTPTPSVVLSPTATAFVPTTAIVTQTSDLPIGVTDKDRQWYEGLRNYLKNELLPMIVPSEPHREMMISKKAMEIWVPCFTHESYDPNIGRNYEELELVGDHAMEFSFIYYMYLTIPSVTRSEMSELKSKYISKSFQAKVGWKIGLEKWVRTRVEKTTHIAEDLLESFFGGLLRVGDNVFKFGAGYGLTYNMIVKIFEGITIDRSLAKGRPKTQMKEIFEKLHWGVPVEDFEQGTEYNEVTARVSFTKEAIQALSELGIKTTDATLAVETGTSKKVAFENAYDVALQKIRKMGITDIWIEQYRGNRDLTNPDLIPYIPAVQRRLKDEGYVNFYFKKSQTTKEGKYIQLIGERPDKYLVVLAMNARPVESELEGKRQVLEIYGSGIQ